MTSLLSALPFLGQGVIIGEDIAGQVKSSLQWESGVVDLPNFIREPQLSNLSEDQSSWSLRPPGAALLPIPGLLIGLSLGLSVQIGILIISLIGGLAWLKIFEKAKVRNSGLLLLSILIGLQSGTATLSYSTANIMLFALAPWFLLWADRLSCSLRTKLISKKGCIYLLFFLFLLGCFAWIKLSGLIVAGTIGAYLLLILLSHKLNTSRTLFFLLLGVSFWVPLLLLEKANVSLAGITADGFYGETDSDLQAPLFGAHWAESTNGFWLAWSTVAAPGYSLPAKRISHGLRDLSLQFPAFVDWIDKLSINAHVLVAGFVGICLTILMLREIILVWSKIIPPFQMLFICFMIFPFIGLALLSYRYGWNYLLYHSHTYEFWFVFLIPIFLVFTNKKTLKSPSIILLSVSLSLPITYSANLIFSQISTNNFVEASDTESRLGLAPNKFSKAITKIESISKNSKDVLLFLPSGDMSDLVLRTRMRTLAIHFAGGNLQKWNIFKTAEPLSVFCAYDSSLSSITEFSNALNTKFPQQVNSEIIHKGEITVLRVDLSPV